MTVKGGEFKAVIIKWREFELGLQILYCGWLIFYDVFNEQHRIKI